MKVRKRGKVKDQLEALILQMYKSNILYSEAVREFKKRFIMTVLEENRGNQCKAARQLGMHRNTLSRTMQELKIDVRPLRAGVRAPLEIAVVRRDRGFPDRVFRGPDRCRHGRTDRALGNEEGRSEHD